MVVSQIRACTEMDIPQIAELEQEIFSDAWSEKSLFDSLEQSHVYMGVVELDQEIVGYTIFYTSIGEGDIARIAVSPKMRRMGIADQLMEDLFSYCQNFKINHILLEVRESNESAIGLYEKYGFVSIGVRKAYYKEPLENGLIMEKLLDISGSIL